MDPVTISILCIAILNCVIIIAQSIKEDHLISSCCKTPKGSLFEIDNDFKGRENVPKNNKIISYQSLP